MDPVSMDDDSTIREYRTPVGRSPAARDVLARARLVQNTVRRGTKPPVAGGGRRAQVAFAVLAAIGIGIAYSYGVSPAVAPSAATASKPVPVRTATVVCPEVIGSADATLSVITPDLGSTPAAGDTATAVSLGSKSPFATLKQTGVLSVNTRISGDAASLAQDSVPVIGQARGAYAPGFTVTETLSSGPTTSQHGLASTACVAPDNDFWYLGADPGAKSTAKINLFDSDQITAQVNLAAYTADGPVRAAEALQIGQGLLVPSGNQHDPIDLGGFSGAGTPIAVHVTATAGRVTGALLDSDGATGRDFIAAQRPAAHLVIPGVPMPSAKPASPMKLQLILFSPQSDTDVTLHWIGSSRILPTVSAPHLVADHVATVDISGVPAIGEAGAMQIDSADNTPILAEIKVTGEGGSDIAYASPVPVLSGEAIVADNAAGSVVQLTNAGTKDAQVRVIVEGVGAPSPQTVTVPAQSTKAVTVQARKGTADFAVSVDPLAAADDLYAARVMTTGDGMITIQPMATALETVRIPPVRNDLSGSVPQ
jgi:hypothetical protein